MKPSDAQIAAGAKIIQDAHGDQWTGIGEFTATAEQCLLAMVEQGPDVEAIVAYLRKRAEQQPSEGMMERRKLTKAHVNYGSALIMACADEVESGKYRVTLGDG